MDDDEAKEQFLATYDEFASDIFRFCLLKVATREIAQDLTQETFMRYWQQVREGKGVENDRAFLYTVARNLIIDWYRRKKDHSLDALAEGGIEFASDDHRSITQNAEVREVLAVIDKVDDDAREALLLRFVDGLSPKEIASITGDTANAVSVRLNRAIKKVQELMHIHD